MGKRKCWERKKESIEKKYIEEEFFLVITGPAGSGARVVVWTVAVEVTEVTVTVVRPVPGGGGGSQILCVVHIRAQTFRTTCDIKVGLVGQIRIARVAPSRRDRP